MNITRFHSDHLKTVFLDRKIATMPELIYELGNKGRHTVLSKLKELSYISSYSHRGAYYTIKNVTDFNAQGLWRFKNICFSRYGNLLETITALVEQSDCGHLDQELENILGVTVRNALLKLTNQKRIKRTKVNKRYFYHSIKSTKGKRQLTKRKTSDVPILFQSELSKVKIHPDELKGAIILLFSCLSEQHRRLYAGLESLRIGHGGDSIVAGFFGIDVKTVAKGRDNLLQEDIEMGRIRKSGAGRKEIKKNT